MHCCGYDVLSEWILAALLQDEGLLECNNGTHTVMLNVQLMETASPLMFSEKYCKQKIHCMLRDLWAYGCSVWGKMLLMSASRVLQ